MLFPIVDCAGHHTGANSEENCAAYNETKVLTGIEADKITQCVFEHYGEHYEHKRSDKYRLRLIGCLIELSKWFSGLRLVGMRIHLVDHGGQPSLALVHMAFGIAGFKWAELPTSGPDRWLEETGSGRDGKRIQVPSRGGRAVHTNIFLPS